MIDKGAKEWHYRVGVTCFDCENLKGCELEDNIRNKDVTWCNYAAEGCKKYKGKEPLRYNDNRITADEKESLLNLREYLLSGKPLTYDKLLDIGATKRQCATIVHSLREKGYIINKTWEGKHFKYQLYGKKD